MCKIGEIMFGRIGTRLARPNLLRDIFMAIIQDDEKNLEKLFFSKSRETNFEDCFCGTFFCRMSKCRTSNCRRQMDSRSSVFFINMAFDLLKSDICSTSITLKAPPVFNPHKN
jgi:hypothetical protein